MRREPADCGHVVLGRTWEHRKCACASTPDCLAHRSMKGCTGKGPTSPVVAMRAVHYCPLPGVELVEVDQLPDKLADGLRLRCLHDTEALRKAQTIRGHNDAPFQGDGPGPIRT